MTITLNTAISHDFFSIVMYCWAYIVAAFYLHDVLYDQFVWNDTLVLCVMDFRDVDYTCNKIASKKGVFVMNYLLLKVFVREERRNFAFIGTANFLRFFFFFFCIGEGTINDLNWILCSNAIGNDSNCFSFTTLIECWL